MCCSLYSSKCTISKLSLKFPALDCTRSSFEEAVSFFELLFYGLHEGKHAEMEQSLLSDTQRVLMFPCDNLESIRGVDDSKTPSEAYKKTTSSKLVVIGLAILSGNYISVETPEKSEKFR